MSTKSLSSALITMIKSNSLVYLSRVVSSQGLDEAVAALLPLVLWHNAVLGCALGDLWNLRLLLCCKNPFGHQPN